MKTSVVYLLAAAYASPRVSAKCNCLAGSEVTPQVSNCRLSNDTCFPYLIGETELICFGKSRTALDSQVQR